MGKFFNTVALSIFGWIENCQGKRILYDTSTENKLKSTFLHLHIGTILIEKH